MNKKMIAYFAGRVEVALTMAAREPQNAAGWLEYAEKAAEQAWEFVA